MRITAKKAAQTYVIKKLYSVGVVTFFKLANRMERRMRYLKPEVNYNVISVRILLITLCYCGILTELSLFL